MIKTQVDDSQVQAMIGAIDGMTATVKTNRYTNAVLKAIHARLADEFDQTLDVIALSAPKNFHHVYEWGMTGVPQARLWKHTFTGAGNSRVAGFRWKASKVPIPTPEERASNPNDPISQLDSKELDKLSKRRYFFYWKAPVMEYNQTVRITGRYSPKKLLFIPTWDEHKIGKEMKPFVFKPSAVIPVPGGENTSGQFSGAWAAWWAVQAGKSFELALKKEIEKDLADSVRTVVRKRSKTISIRSNTSTAYAAGKADAMAFLASKINKYDREGDDLDE